jgi:peptide/nickel transport system permease protein
VRRTSSLTRFLRIPLSLLIAGLLLIALMRFAPGYGVDERELDPRFDRAGIAAIRQARVEPVDLLKKALHGDLGTSEVFNTSVAQLLSERWKTTLVSVLAGLAMAWTAALAWAGFGALFRPLDWAGSAMSFGLLSMPSGLLAIGLFLAGAPVSVGIAIAVFPQIHRYVRQLTFDALSQPCIFAAAARGVGWLALLLRHARALISPQLLALLGTSAATAAGAAIPMEAICGAPGLGQLAWRAALGRDLALLLPLVLSLTVVIQLASLASELLQPEAV